MQFSGWSPDICCYGAESPVEVHGTGSAVDLCLRGPVEVCYLWAGSRTDLRHCGTGEAMPDGRIYCKYLAPWSTCFPMEPCS